MLLNHDEISDLLDQEVVEYADKELINASSLDIRIGSKVLIERPFHKIGESIKVPAGMTIQEYMAANPEGNFLRRISLAKREPLCMAEFDIRSSPLILYPGEFVLAQSHELFNLPNDISAEYKLKSSMARIGLEHLNAGWCDAGWNGSVLTLEIKNMTRHHEIEIKYLDKIGQMVFFRHRPVKDEHSYATKGRYNGHTSVMGAVSIPEEVEEIKQAESMTANGRKVLIIGDDNEL